MTKLRMSISRARSGVTESITYENWMPRHENKCEVLIKNWEFKPKR
jgi:hypothetical protein